MPPAHGLTDADAADAADVLEAATERGVGDLPASPFLKATPCGVADGAVVRTGRAHRTALVSLRRARATRGNVRAADRRVRVAKARLAAAKARKLRICSPEATTSTSDDDATLRGTTTTERPRSVVAGTGMVIALPIEFADVRADRTAHAPSRYRDLLFGEDYPHGGGSLASFYEAMSYGSFTVDGDVEGWRRMPKRRAAYAADSGGMGAYPGNSQLLLEDAVRANDGSVNFAAYDNDGPDKRPNSGDDDGFVDAVFLVYAGTSAAENGNLDALWPHAWRHTVATGDRSANGGFIKVGRYAAVPERMEQTGPDGDLLTVGVVAHEFGHVLGLPDLVDGDDGHAGPGQWDLMSSGMWGFEHSSRPSGLSAWSRSRLGWVTPQLLEGDHVGHRLAASYAQRSIVKLPVAGAPLHEHYLVERRTRTGFDADAPGDGLLVWHVDDSVASGSPSKHPRVELVAADGAGNGDVGDLLAAGGSLNDSSTPDTNAHDGSDSLVAIQNVQDEAVDLHAGKASLAPAIDASTEEAGPQAAAPTAVMTAPVAGARVRGSVTLSCTGTGNPNVSRLYFYRNSTTNLGNVVVTPTAATATRTYAFDTTTRPDGANTLACRARNTSNQYSAYANVAVVIDNTAPATPTISTPAAAPTWLRGTVGWTATGTDNYGVTNFSYRVDGIDNWQTAWTELTPKSNTFNWDTTTATNGSHALTVRSEDLAGNQSAVSTTRMVNVDNALPTLAAPTDGTVLPDIDQQSSTTTLNARWTAGTDAHSGIASYSWRFCTTPACGTVVASGSGAGLTATAGSLALANGMYYACVRVTDVAGNQSADQCSDGVNVDNVAPTMGTPMDAAVAPDLDFQASTTSLNAVWAAANDGAGTGVAGYDWRFCTSPACGSVLASGSGAGLTATAGSLALANATTYYVCVRARDQLVNTSGYVCSDGITVDTVTPGMSTPLDGAPAPDIDFQASTTSLSASWSAATETGSGIAAYDWRFCPTVACGTITASGSGAALTATAGSLTLAPGTTYYACVRARDNVALQSAYVCSDGVLVDNGPPTMSVPTDGIPAPDIDFQASSTTLSASWVAATDGGSGIAGYDWRFCPTVGCGTVLASGSGAGLTATAGSLGLTNGTTYFACVRARDSAANPSAYVCSDGVTVDNAAPTMSTPNDGTPAPDLDAQASTTTLDANWAAASDGTGSGVASYDWRFCTTPACGTILANGSGAGTSATAGSLTLTVGTTYYACVRAIDQLGLPSAYVCSDGVLIDAAPVVTITSPTNGDGVGGTELFSATATDAVGITKVEWFRSGVAGAQQTNNYAASSPRTSTWSWNTGPIPEGTYTITVVAHDGGGATGTDSITVVVDKTSPTLTNAGITNGAIVSGIRTLTSSAADGVGLDRIEYWVDGISRATASAGGATSFNDPGSSLDTTVLSDGNHWYTGIAFDEAGNMALSGSGETHFVVSNVADGANPTGTITSPAAGPLAASNVSLTVNAGDNVSVARIEWLLDGAPISGVQDDLPLGGFTSGLRTRTWASTTSVSTGAHVLTARVTDAAGNQFTTPGVSVSK